MLVAPSGLTDGRDAVGTIGARTPDSGRNYILKSTSKWQQEVARLVLLRQCRQERASRLLRNPMLPSPTTTLFLIRCERECTKF